jgi:hypothetical protein
MTRHDALVLVESLTYKPGWLIYATWDGDDLRVRIDAKTIDVENGNPRTLHSWKRLTAPVVLQMTLPDLADVLFRWVLDVEVHEAQEWFKIAGLDVQNPPRTAGAAVRRVAMTRREALHLVRAVTYKPRWSITPSSMTRRDLWITITIPATDQASGTLLTTSQHTRLLWADVTRLDASELADLIFRSVLEAEEHEAGEWFRVHGLPSRSPHAMVR